MKVIKKINNNIAIAVDGENNEVIVFAKGIGYGNIPYEIKDPVSYTHLLYDKLKSLNSLQTIRTTDIDAVLEPDYYVNSYGVIDFMSNGNNFFELFFKLYKGDLPINNDISEKYNVILNVLRKARIYMINNDLSRKNFIIFDEEFIIDKNFLTYNYNAMLKYIVSDLNDTENLLKRGYYFFKLSKYEERCV